MVLRGVTHGAVDFLIKPVRLEELRNAWQHVVRRKRERVRLQQIPFFGIANRSLSVVNSAYAQSASSAREGLNGVEHTHLSTLADPEAAPVIHTNGPAIKGHAMKGPCHERALP